MAGSGNMESEFFDNIRRAVVNNNKDDFYELLKDPVKKEVEAALAALNDARSIGIDTFIAGVHYVSYATGKWYRIITKRPEPTQSALTPLEIDYYEERQSEVASRGLNLYTDDDLKGRLHLAFVKDAAGANPAAFDCIGRKEDLKLFQDLCDDTNLIKFALSSDVEFCNCVKSWIDKHKGDHDFIAPDLKNLPDSLRTISEYQRSTRVADDFLHLQKLIDCLADVLIGSKQKFSSWRIEQVDALLKQKCTLLNDEFLVNDKKKYEEYYKHLAKDDWENLAKRLWTLRLFIFSFYSTLHLKNIPPDQHLFLVIDPFYWSQKAHNEAKDICIRYMAFGIAYAAALPCTDDELDRIRAYLLSGLRGFFHAELHYGLSHGNGNVIVAEDSIRQCTILSKEVLDEVNLYKNKIEEDWLVYSHKDTKEKFAKKFVGRSSKVIEMIERIREIVKVADYDKEKNQYKLPKGKCIFMHSLPGCGKENLAKLIHLVSCRNYYSDKNEQLRDNHFSQNNSHIVDLIADYNQTFSSELNDAFPGGTSFNNAAAKDIKDKVKQYFVAAKAVMKAKGNPLDKPLEIKEGELFNYRVQHCGELNDPQRFLEVLFGYQKERLKKDLNWAGLMPVVHGLGGTLFLDELNTLPPALSVKFLRIFEDPSEIEMPWDSKRYRMGINILTIFASNLDASGLIDRKFSPAVIGRITQNTFKIPPLRDRKEDIAVFVNSCLQESREKDESGFLKNLSRINLDALRLICELPWLDNYRGVNGLLNEIIMERKYRRITTPYITFDEVIKALSKRELLALKGAEEEVVSAFKA